jgi:hypothetical protein
MYTDPRHVFEFVDNVAGTTVEVEAAAAILKRIGTAADVGTAATAALDGVRCPAGADIEAFGFTITEALTNAHATNAVLTLQTCTIEGGAATATCTMTLPADSTEVTLANVRPSGRTVAQAVAVGARWLCSSTNLPFHVVPGGYFYVEMTVAAGAAGGAIRPFVVVRFPGNVDPTTASPVTTIAA